MRDTMRERGRTSSVGRRLAGLLVICAFGCADIEHRRLGAPPVLWQWEMPLPQGMTLRDAWVSPAGDVVAVGGQGTILVHDGFRWRAVDSHTAEDLVSVSGRAADEIYAIGRHRTALRFDGNAWTETATMPAAGFWWESVFCAGIDDVFAVGRGGAIARYDGNTWKKMTNGSSQNLYGVWGRGPDDVYAVGQAGTILHWDGTSWTPEVSGVSDDLHDVWGSGGVVLAAGSNAAVLQKGASGWAAVPNVVPGDYLAIGGAGPNDVWVAGHTGRVMHFDGSRPSLEATDTSVTIHAVAVARAATVAVGDNGLLLRREGPSRWLLDSLGEDDPPEVRALDMDDAQNGWAVGYAGHVWRKRDGAWSRHPSPTTQFLEHLWADGDTVFAMAEEAIFRTDGQGWTTSLTPPANEGFQVLDGSAPDNLYAFTDGGTAFHYGGTSWTRLTARTQIVVDAWVHARDDVHVLVTDGFDVTAQHFDGGSFTTLYVFPSFVGTISGSSPDNVWAGNTLGECFRYDGRRWGPVPGPGIRIFDLLALGESDVLTAGGAEKSLSHYNGDAWVHHRSPGPVITLAAAGPEVVHGASDHGILRYSGHWTLESGPVAVDFRDVWVAPDGDAFVVGEFGAVMRRTAGTWRDISIGPSPTLTGVSGSSGRDVVAVGSGGAIWRLKDYVWTDESLAANVHVNDVWVHRDGTAIAAVADGTVLRNTGAGWQDLGAPPGTELNAVWGASPTDVYVVGTGGVVMHYDGFGWSTWQSPDQEALLGVWGSGPDDVFAVGERGTIFHDGGGGWTREVSGVRRHLWDVWGTSAKDVFACGEKGELLHYDGRHWRRIGSDTTAELYGLAGRPGGDVFAVGRAGTLRRGS